MFQTSTFVNLIYKFNDWNVPKISFLNSRILLLFLIHKNNQNIMFSHQNQQTSSFNEQCCTSDNFLTHFKFLILFDRTGSSRYIFRWSHHKCQYRWYLCNFKLYLLFCQNNPLNRNSGPKSENSKVTATFVKPKSAFYLQDCSISLDEKIDWYLFF